jgi:hypothetical protein
MEAIKSSPCFQLIGNLRLRRVLMLTLGWLIAVNLLAFFWGGGGRFDFSN